MNEWLKRLLSQIRELWGKWSTVQKVILFAVVGGAVLGLALGGVGTAALNTGSLTVENQYVNILFGGEPIRGTVTAGLIGVHLLAAVGLALVALLYPLKRALKIAPVEAMAE